MRVKLFVCLILSIALASLFAMSMEDLEKEWAELLNKIAREPDSDVLVEIGKKLSAKRRLAELEALREAVLEEDLDKFLLELSNMTDVREDLLDECFVLFPKLKEDVSNLERGDFSNVRKVSPLWKLGYKPDLPKDFAGWLVETFLNDPFILDWNLVFFLKNCSNKVSIAEGIRQECEKLKDREELYPALYRLMVLAKQLDGVQTRFESDLNEYMELITDVERLSHGPISNEEFERISKRFSELNLKKDNLKALLNRAVQNLGVGSLQTKRVEWTVHKAFVVTALIASILLLTMLVMPRRSKIRLFAFFKMYRIAIILCQKELKKTPTDIDLRTQLAMLYERIGETEKAFQEYKVVKDLSRMVKKDRFLPRA